MQMHSAVSPEIIGDGVTDMDYLLLDCELKLADTGDGVQPGTISGYASTFNNIDDGGDIVMPGAFKATLANYRKRKSMPAMLWQHDPRQPIGLWKSMTEDEKGLKVDGELLTEIPQGAVVHALLKRGAINGLSIGYRTKDFEIDKQTGARRIKKADLFEASLVTFPMNSDATVTSVKADSIFPTDREIEEALRDGGLSNRDAKIGVAVFKKMVLRDGARPEQGLRDGGADVLMAIRRASEVLRG